MPHVRIAPPNETTTDPSNQRGSTGSLHQLTKLPTMSANDLVHGTKSVIRKSKTLIFGLAADSPGGPVRKRFVVSVPLPGYRPDTVDVKFNVDAPHGLSWQVDIFHSSDYGGQLGGTSTGTAAPAATEGEPALPRGSVSLYVFPTVHTECDPRGIKPSWGGVDILCRILHHLSNEPDSAGAFEAADPSGAYAMHALMACNTDESLKLAQEIYSKRPRLLLQVLSANGPFLGESSLHIACVNRREQLLVDLIALAVAELTADDVMALLRSQAEGSFFSNFPMRTFGSTILSYACCFEMREAILALLRSGHVDLNKVRRHPR